MSDHRPFHPAWLDDRGLRAEPHRVLCHLWRRADGNGVSWPSVATIARICRMERKTVWRALSELEAEGLLRREPVAGRSTRYVVTVPTHPAKPPIPQSHPGSQAARHPVGQTGREVVGQTGCHPSRKATHEGTPRKEPQEVTPRKEPYPAPAGAGDGAGGKQPHQLRAEALMRRRPTTPMSASEIRAWKTANAVVRDASDDDWNLLEWWYSLPPDRAPYRKTDFAALLNNWHAEIEKARRNKGSKVEFANAW